MPPEIHGTHGFDNLLHVEATVPSEPGSNIGQTRVFHVAVSGDGWRARCIELDIEASGKDQSETLANLKRLIEERLK